MHDETFWTLLHDAAHWEFEAFLMVLFDLLLGGILWPFVRKHWEHHVLRDKRDEDAQALRRGACRNPLPEGRGGCQSPD